MRTPDELPVSFLTWSLALTPILVLLVLLAVRRWKAHQAGPVGMFVAAAIALITFRTPWDTLAVAGAKGVWDAIYILYVVWPALLLYLVTDRAGGYEALRQGVMRFSRNELFIVVALGWVFSSFLQGIAGFGTPIAIVAPLLVAFGVKPVYAVAIPIIAHIWAKMFGTLAAGWLATLQVVDLENQTQAAVHAAILLLIPTFLGGFTVVWMFGRWAAIRHAWPLVLIIASIQGGGQLVLMYLDPVLSAFLAATASLIALYPLSRWKRYAEPAESIKERPAMRDEGAQGEIEHEREAPMGLLMSFVPYVVLTAVALGTLLVQPVEDAFASVRAGMPFPGVQTGYGVTNDAAEPYSPFAPLTHPGTFLLVTSLVTWLVYRARGYYEAWESKDEGQSLWRGLLDEAVPASVPIVAFLVMARVMDHSGQNEVLALGIAAVAPAYVFAFLSSTIGVVGAFMTSSSTSSNVLFSDLQKTVGELKGLPESTIIGAQSAGGAIGNAIAPANLVLGTSTAGISGKEGDVLRKTIPWTIVATVLTGLATVLLVVLTGEGASS